MSFQAYLGESSVGFDESTKVGEIVAWLEKDFDLGHGHVMSHVIKKWSKN